MLELFQIHLDRICPGWKKRRFLAAFSGGLDSTALLHLLARSLPADQLAAAHLNHQIRLEAESDKIFAASISDGLGIAFISEAIDVPHLAKTRHRGLEEAARFARYEFFKRAVRHWPPDFMVTAHQADDQAETVLMHLIKGGGGGGLAGIHVRRPLFMNSSDDEPELLRPLLPFTREQLRNWLQKMNLGWVEDSSNDDGRYLRNNIRRDILPKLKEINPRLPEAIWRASSIMRDEENFWQFRVSELWPQMVDEKNHKSHLIVDRSKLAALTIAEQRRVIYEAFLKIWRSRAAAPEPLSFNGVETVLSMLVKPWHKGLDLPGGIRAELTTTSLLISLASRLRA